MTDKNLERRIAKLESLIMNESLSEAVSDDIIEKLGNMNKSNQFDSGNFRWITAVNALSRLVDIMLADEVRNVDPKDVDKVYKTLEKYGYESGADLVIELISSIDRKAEDLRAAKKNLSDILKSAKKFDKANK